MGDAKNKKNKCNGTIECSIERIERKTGVEKEEAR